MALDASALAKKIHEALAQKTDGHGQPTQISEQTKAYAAGIVAAIKAGTFSNATGTITGVTAPGAPLSGGAGAAGIMVLTPAPMIAKSTVGIPPQAIPLESKENVALIQYIGTGLVVFTAGGITGTCTNSPVSPGPLTGGAGANGKITGLTGAACATAVAAALGGPLGPDAIKHYTAVITYILVNAVAAYTAGQVTGVCPAAGGPLSAGTGVGGKIT